MRYSYPTPGEEGGGARVIPDKFGPIEGRSSLADGGRIEDSPINLTRSIPDQFGPIEG